MREQGAFSVALDTRDGAYGDCFVVGASEEQRVTRATGVRAMSEEHLAREIVTHIHIVSSPHIRPNA